MKLQEQLWRVSELSSLPSPYEEPDETAVPFEEGFPEWWTSQSFAMEREISLIPSIEFRAALGDARRGIDDASYLHGYGFGRGYRDAVQRSALLGLDLVAAWLRGERALPEETAEALAGLRDSLRDLEGWWAETEEARTELG